MINLSSNHFELFGLPVGFVLDSQALAERYRELQRAVHPDRFASASDQEQRLALQQATRVNEAYETLRDPLRRAQYLLQLHGIDSDGETATTRDASFLMQQMELREALAGVRDAADPEAELDALMREIRQMIDQEVAQLAVQFEAATPDSLNEARETVSRMQFLNKLYNEAEALEAEMEESY